MMCCGIYESGRVFECFVSAVLVCELVIHCVLIPCRCLTLSVFLNITAILICHCIICLEVKREYYQKFLVLDCVTDWLCHIGTLTLCMEAVA